MPKSLTIAISSTALFDLDESDEIYREEGLEAYRQYQIDQEDRILTRGSYIIVKEFCGHWPARFQFYSGF